MLIPRHWSKANGTADDPSGKRFAFQIWGWSETDLSEAAALARRRLSEACARVARGALLLEPDSSEARELLAAFEADPFFVKLCKLQASFRARLTPKPWRCGCRLPPNAYPRPDLGAEPAFTAWLQEYEAAIRSKASCEFIETCGPGAPLPDIAPIVAEHDRTSRVGEKLPLA